MASLPVFLKKWMLPTLLFVSLPFFFVEDPSGDTDQLVPALWNLGHILYFCLAIVALRRHLDMRDWPHWLTISIAVFLISIIIEYLQYEVGREQGWHEIELNLIGAWLGIFWLNPGGPQVWTGRVIATGLVIHQITIVTQAGLTDYRIKERMPLITGLEMPYEAGWWQGPVSRTDDVSLSGQYSLRVDFSTDSHSGARLETLPRDWTGYDRLRFHVYNPYLTPMNLTLRIIDRLNESQPLLYSDRYHFSFTAENGWNEVIVDLEDVKNAPSDRMLNLGKIAQLEVFTTNLREPRTVFFDGFWLEATGI